jgi:hypothetical protein
MWRGKTRTLDDNMDDLARSHLRRVALRASYVCAAVAAALLAAHFNAGLFPAWTRGLGLLSGGIAVAGTGLAAAAIGTDGWSDLRAWAGQLSFAINAFLGIAFIASVGSE